MRPAHRPPFAFDEPLVVPVTDTIHALASGPPPAGIAVIRVSGPLVPTLAREWIGRPLPPRAVTLVALRDRDGAVLDDALAIRFPAPRSFTGEDVLELHCHGGRAVTHAVRRRLSEMGSRPAEPGEFTMRAHRNGRIDLIEAERLADLIDAETEAQRRLAMSPAGRRNAALYGSWRDQLIDLRALIEASLDFADEEDAPSDASGEIAERLAVLRDSLCTHLNGTQAVRIARDGYRVALAGAPNAGKSSLLNALAGQDVAIVSDIPGTTRDVVEVVLDLGGHRIVLADTAGLRETSDPVEEIGVARARARMAEADLVLHLVPVNARGTDVEIGERCVVVVRTKSDLLSPSSQRPAGIVLSVRSGDGLDDLLRMVEEQASNASWRDTDALAPLAERHAAHVRRALEWLHRANELRDERLAEAVRLAAEEIGRITGATDIEDVYGAIFSRFCMGK